MTSEATGLSGTESQIKLFDSDTPRDLTFRDRGRDLFRITPDLKVILSSELYEAAKGFWDAVKQCAPEGYSLQVEGEEV